MESENTGFFPLPSGMAVCDKCAAKLSIFTETGMHNFCPTSTSLGEVISVCMKCKMDEVKKRWHRN
ncbi:MAG: hypothetical protein EXS48_02285 [Candidatus Staskawiczbacteria bacterium]|nr:hypothetical protein [Candidatus Staskawiczbacteria bacterium]